MPLVSISLDQSSIDLLNRISTGCQKPVAWAINRAVGDYLQNGDGNDLIQSLRSEDFKSEYLRRKIQRGVDDAEAGRFSTRSIDEILDEVMKKADRPVLEVELFDVSALGLLEAIEQKLRQPVSTSLTQAVEAYLTNGEGADILADIKGLEELDAGLGVDLDVVLAKARAIVERAANKKRGSRCHA